MFKGFRDFILRGNVVDMAIGIMIGAAFNSVVTALVSDVFNPLIASTVGKPDFKDVFYVIHGGQVKIGELLNAVISFFIVSAVVYFCIVLPMHFFMRKLSTTPPPPPAKKTCPECLSMIPAAARRCCQCGEVQPEPQPQPVEASA